MHAIPMAVPQLFEAGSSPAEKKAIRQALTACLRQLQALNGRTRLRESEDHGQVEFLVPRAFHADSSSAENAPALESLLVCLATINLAYRRFRPGTPFLYASPVRYDRTEVWDSTPALRARGYGDCNSLACDRVAELWAAGLDARPFFRFLPPEQATTDQYQFHILLLGPWGWECPSKVKGMNAPENSYFGNGASAPAPVANTATP